MEGWLLITGADDAQSWRVRNAENADGWIGCRRYNDCDCNERHGIISLGISLGSGVEAKRRTSLWKHLLIREMRV